MSYLVGLTSKELPARLEFGDNITNFCYRDAVAIFARGMMSRPDRARLLDELVDQSTFPSASDGKIFHDLTVYLVPYFLGAGFSTVESELAIYQGRFATSLGMPAGEIAGKTHSFDDISGPIKENMYYGIQGLFPRTVAIQLPKDMTIKLTRDDGLTSTYLLKNKYVEIRIGIRNLYSKPLSNPIGYPFVYITSGLSAISPYPDGLRSEWLGPFVPYDTIVYLDADFDRFWYGSREMKYHEEWVESIFALLEKKFAWGHPLLVGSRSRTAPPMPLGQPSR